MLVAFTGMLAYAAPIFAIMVAASGAVARTGRATWNDVARGVRSQYWSCLGLTALVAVVLFPLLGIVAMPAVIGPSVEAAATSRELTSTVLMKLTFVMLGLGAAITLALGLLFGFAPAAMGVDGLGAVAGIGRGLGFVGRRFGLAFAAPLMFLCFAIAYRRNPAPRPPVTPPAPQAFPAAPPPPA